MIIPIIYGGICAVVPSTNVQYLFDHLILRLLKRCRSASFLAGEEQERAAPGGHLPPGLSRGDGRIGSGFVLNCPGALVVLRHDEDRAG